MSVLGCLRRVVGATTLLALATVAAPMAGSGQSWSETEPTVVPTTTPDADGWTRMSAGAADYAPAGMPDFDQRQGAWRVQGAGREVWTHDGPVAVANGLWWLDSQLEPEPTAPLEPRDGFDLVQAHGHWDDHDPANVAPVVTDLVLRSGTNGPQRLLAVGTCLDQLHDGLAELLAGSRQRPRFGARVIDRPNRADLLAAVAKGQPTVLLVGLWQEHDMAGWRRIGGHYATLAAVDGFVGRLQLSDPLRDASGPTDLFTVHNDARNVSHDSYTVSPSLRPGPVLRLDGYLDDSPASMALVANFAGLNPRHCSGGDSAWLDGAHLEAQIEAALVIEPVAVPTDTATPSPTATEPPTVAATATVTPSVQITATRATTIPVTATLPTPTVAPATATDTPVPTTTATTTPTPSPTATPTATASATATPTLTPTATTTPEPTFTPGPGSVCGRVVTGANQGIVGAEVAALQGEAVVAGTWSGLDGQYCLFDLSPGLYLLRARRSACESTPRVLMLSGGMARADLEVLCRATDVYLPLAVVQRARARAR